jgi:hypothetical protein
MRVTGGSERHTPDLCVTRLFSISEMIVSRLASLTGQTKSVENRPIIFYSSQSTTHLPTPISQTEAPVLAFNY